MPFSRLKHVVLVPVAIVAGVLAPWRMSSGGLAAEATAECTTCCPDPQSRCVVCAEKCISQDDHYDKGIGKCPVSTT